MAPVDIILIRSRVAELAVDDADVGDDAAVGVVDRVEDHRAGRGVRRRRPGPGSAGRSRRAARATPTPVLPETRSTSSGSQPMRLASSAAYFSGWAAGRSILLSTGMIVQVVLQREVEVGQRLRLDALRGVDEQDRALAGGERAGDLVGEVDVAGGVDHVEHVGRACRPRRVHGIRTAWLLIVMPRSRSMSIRSRYCARIAAVVDDAGELQHPVGQRRLAVVDVGDDAEVADQLRRRGGGWSGCGRGVTRAGGFLAWERSGHCAQVSHDSRMPFTHPRAPARRASRSGSTRGRSSATHA